MADGLPFAPKRGSPEGTEHDRQTNPTHRLAP